MATLAQRTQAVEERTDRLETILASFMAQTEQWMAQTDRTIGRLERIIERMEQEGARDREAAARDRDAAAREREAAARDREAAAQERRDMNKRWGELANKMGTVVEDIVAPGVRRLAREVFNCGDMQYFGTRVSLKRSDDPSREREFDALYVGTRAVLLNQTKSSPRIDDVRDFEEFLRSNQFALYFPGLPVPISMGSPYTRRPNVYIVEELLRRPAPAPPTAAPTAAAAASSPGRRPSSRVARCVRATFRATRPALPPSGRSTGARSAALPATPALLRKTAPRTRARGLCVWRTRACSFPCGAPTSLPSGPSLPVVLPANNARRIASRQASLGRTAAPAAYSASAAAICRATSGSSDIETWPPWTASTRLPREVRKPTSSSVSRPTIRSSIPYT